MKNRLNRFLACLLCCAMVCTMFTFGGKTTAQAADAATEEYISEGEDVGPEVYTAPERTAVSFDEMTDNSYDAAAADAALEQMTTLCTQPHTLKKIKEAYDVLIDQYDRLCTDYAITDIHYYQNVTDEAISDRDTELNLQASQLGDSFLTALAAVLASPYREAMITYINDDAFVEDADGYTAMEDAEYDLIEEESNLVQQYYTLSEDEGATAEEFEQLYLDLLDNRIAQAAYEEDYEDYCEYAYASVYQRDYNPADAETLAQWAKDFACPMEDTILYLLYLGDYDMDTFYSLNLSQDEIVKRVQPCVSSVSEEAAKAFQTMIDLNLLDLNATDTKGDGGFTTTLYSYGVPFIFNCPYGYASDLETLVHEFGHYYEAVTNMRPAAYNYDCYDTCEIDSQGMEVLMFDYADEIFGEDLGGTAVMINLYNLLSAVVDGCIFDEFQQQAFEARKAGTLTEPAQVTELFCEIENSFYGMEGMGWGENWYQVPHTFSSPFYYISYATSAAAALSLLSVAEQNRDDAVSVYNELVTLGNEEGFFNTMEILGLPNPMTEDGQNEISEGVTEFVFGQAAQSGMADFFGDLFGEEQTPDKGTAPFEEEQPSAVSLAYMAA